MLLGLKYINIRRRSSLTKILCFDTILDSKKFVCLVMVF